mmetsp:Transcript_39162/g.100328  ORF Transcript_39162/g.100328 Transcript_39162/m.100328 type:complete len:215 (-) Transcript_39162:599-1243(-)
MNEPHTRCCSWRPIQGTTLKSLLYKGRHCMYTCAPPRSSTALHTQMSRSLATSEKPCMLEFFLQQRAVYQRRYVFFGQAPPQRISQADLVGSKQAYLQVAISKESDAVASTAKVITHRCDKAHSPSMPWHVVHLRGVIDVANCPLKRVLSLDHVQHLRVRHHFFCTPFVVVERHVLDEPHFDVAIFREFDKVKHLILVHISHHHHIHFQAGQPS